MATTTNYGWTTPDDTALVKDGAAAIRTLGTSVDTTTKNLNPSTTLGDIEYRSSSANVNTRLGIGSSGQVLTVSGGVPAWTTASASSQTLLSTTTLSGTSTSISITPTGYKDLKIIVTDWHWTSGGDGNLSATFNNDTTAFNYVGVVNYYRSFNANAGVTGTNDSAISLSFYDWGQGDEKNAAVIDVFAVNETGAGKVGFANVSGKSNNGYPMTQTNAFMYNATTAISSFQFRSNRTFAGGTVKIYGVN